MNALDDFTRKCSLWRDEFLLEELDKGPAGYAHLEYFAVIQAEAVRRGLPLSPTPLVLDALRLGADRQRPLLLLTALPSGRLHVLLMASSEK